MQKTARVRFLKKSKKKQEPKIEPITQLDYYEEATSVEEQAERWLLSDIKKSLRFYLQAFQLYNEGLSNGQESSDKCTYDIYYNETRLLLQIYTDYLANDGYINILQYVKLDDISDVSNILLSLPEITSKLEIVYQTFIKSNNDTWDLQFNLLTSYLSLIESNETYNIFGENIIEITNKFIELSQSLIKKQVNELENWQKVLQEDSVDNETDLKKDTLGDQGVNSEGSGIITNSDNNNDKEETMEVSDQITKESLEEVFVDSYKFVEALLEIIIQSKLDKSKVENEKLNVVQINYLEDLINKFFLQLNDIINTGLQDIQIDLEDIDVARFSIDGDMIILSGDLDKLKSFITTEVNSNTEENYLNIQLVKIDTLEFAIECLSNEKLEIQWELSSLVNIVLADVRSKLTLARNDILTNGKFDQKKNDSLSGIVFQLCNIYVTSSDNELRRLVIKQAQGGDNVTKLSEILMKNSKTLLLNASKIAERPCGMQETIVDKLKRNYIFNQIKIRLGLLEGNTSNVPSPVDNSIEDLLKDHPFYSQLG